MRDDLFHAKVQCLRNNIRRYCRLLATELTETERAYIHGRIAREQADLEALLLARGTGEDGTPQAFIAANARQGEARNHRQS